MKRATTGKSLAEYGMILGLVLIVSLGGITLIANTFSASFPGWLACITTGQNCATGSSTSNPIEGTPVDLPNDNGDPGDGGLDDTYFHDPLTDGEYCFASGFCFNPPEPVETAGGLGNEEVNALADFLSDLANQIAQVDPGNPVIQMIHDLANQGHGMANDLTIGCATMCNDAVSSQQLVDIVKGELPDFLNQFDAVIRAIETDDALAQFPELSILIDFAAMDIHDIINDLTVVNGFIQNDATANTHMDANTICGTTNSSGCIQNPNGGG